eukprot:9674820-Alexandrium_andersonii.AAC.1
MHHAIGLGSDARRSKARHPASDPPTDGCRRVQLASGAIGTPDADEALEEGIGDDELFARQEGGATGPPGGPRSK